MSDEKKTAAPVSKTQRFLKLAGMTASVAGDYAKSRIKSVFQDKEQAEAERTAAHASSGQRIAETLGELKGVAMKIGQMASVAGDVLPRELSSALVSLQKEAPPMSYEVIASQIEAELGAPPELLFARFDRTPFASASIGQVHRACTDDGREVVVKVQYPGVDTSVDSDLMHLKVALKASGLIKMDRKSFNVVFDEIRARLVEELDYCNEADNVRLFHDFHKQHDWVVTPEVIGERSAKRVLTLSWEPGDNINELDNLGYSQRAMDTIGANLVRLFLTQAFELRAIHADPNPANFAFHPDGRVVLYDYGCVKRLDAQILKDYAATAWAAFTEDYQALDDGLRALGARPDGSPALPPEFYKPWRDTLLAPFITEGPFDYGASTVHDDVKRLIPGALKHINDFQPVAEVVFMDRVIVGHYGTMRTLGANIPIRELVLPYVRPEGA